MTELARLGLDEVIRECAATKPFLGICLGMQALLEFSEENNGTPGLGILRGQVVGFPVPFIDVATDERLKVPHMGWNEVHQTRTHPLWAGIAQDSRFYFVHSYYAVPANAEQVAGTVHYGRDVTVALAKENIFAVQFHPEKSQHAGLALLANFMSWDGAL
jgi:glutamine amidotransferase